MQTFKSRQIIRWLMPAALGLIIGIPAVSARAGETAIVPDFRHVRVENPASLSNEQAENIYRQIAKDLETAFESSNLAEIRGHQKWRRYNTEPYLSSTHGNRYINNYANEAAAGYGALKKGAVMPSGSVIVKDSFAVSQEGLVMPGRLFVMEKLYAGAHPSTGDWRYVMIGADGAVIADTTGITAPQAEFCHVCHKVRAARDFLFFVPPDFRIPNTTAP